MAEYRSERMNPGWWTSILIMVIAGVIALTTALFSGSFTAYIPVTVTSDRAGQVMEIGSKVKMRGVQVGRVSQITAARGGVTLKLDILKDQVIYIPANVRARIRATTLFSAKFVDLVYPDDPSPNRLSAGTVIGSDNVGTEVDTVFQNLVTLLRRVDPAKLNGVLAALAEGLRGRGPAIGKAITDANEVLLAVNPRADTARANLAAVKGFSDTSAAAAKDIIAALGAAATTSTTVTDNTEELDQMLASAIGLSHIGTALIGSNAANLVEALHVLAPTTQLLNEYNPSLTCMLVGAKVALDTGYADATGGGNGRSLVIDTALLLGADQYQYPDNLPIIGAKDGPGGKPSCVHCPMSARIGLCAS
jgi:phospholipid/cholesterol/gamma-HCH transport system substrate-binding protein